MSDTNGLRNVLFDCTASPLRHLLLSVASCAIVIGLSSVAAAQSSTRLDEITAEGREAGSRGGTAGPTTEQRTRLPGQPLLEAREAARGPIEGYVARSSTTATKTSTPLIETPQSISVIGAKQIQDQAATSLDQALNYTPGVRGQTFGPDYRNDWFVLRGFKAQDTGYYLDGLQLFSFGFSTFKIQPWGLERIEVLRGPSASLYGGGNPGGVINAVSKRPTFTNFGVVEAGVDNFGNAYGAFDFGGVVGERNEWSYRLTGLGRAGGTQVDFTDNNTGYIAPTLAYRPDGGTSLTFFGQYTYNDTRSQNFLPYVGTVVRAPFGRIPTNFFSSDPATDTFRRHQAIAGYEFEHAFDASTVFRQNFRFATADVLLDSYYGGGYVVPPTATQGLLSRGNFFAHDAAFLTNIDNNLEHRFVTGPLAHTALVGLDYRHYGQNQNNGFDVGAPIDVVNPDYSVPRPPVSTRYAVARNSFDQLGVYAQDQIKYDRLSLLLGIRYDLLQQSLNDKLFAGDATKETGKFSGRVGLIYNFDSGFAPYVSYSTSFNPLIVTSAAGTLSRPETGEQYEVGLKYASPELPITASIALFDLTRQNVPVTNPNAAIPVYSIQIGEQNSRGIEAEVRASLADGFSVIGAYTAYDLKVTRDLDPTLIGKTPTEIPEQFASLWLDYTIPAGEYRGLGFAAGVRYVGESFATADNLLKVPEIYLGDLSVHYDTGRWRAALNVTNVTDEKYVASCTLISACYYADRRRTTVSLAYRW